MADPSGSPVTVRLTRDLTYRDVTLLGIGAMVGGAIFVLAGSAARVSGPGAIAAVLLSAVVAGLTALAYAELATSRPGASGGGYGWVRDGLPAPSGFLSGWLSWGGQATAVALSALGLAVLTDFVLRSLGISLPGVPRDFIVGGTAYNLSEKALALAFLAVFALGSYLGTPSLRSVSPLTFTKLAALGGFLLVALVAAAFVPDLASRFDLGTIPIGAPGVLLAAGLLFVAFEGFEVIAQSADQVKSPRRAIPRALFVGLGAVTALYAVFLVALLASVPTSASCGGSAWACLGHGPGGGGEPELGSTFAALSIGWASPLGPFLFLLAALLSMVGALVATLTAASRVAFSMGRDGTLPSPLAHISSHRTPSTSLVATCAFSGLLVLALSIEQLGAVASIFFLLLFSFVNAAAVALRRKLPVSEEGFRLPGFPVVPIAAAILSSAIALWLWQLPPASPTELASPGRIAWYTAGLWLAVGLIFHFFAGGRQALGRVTERPRVELVDVLSAPEAAIDRGRYRVFLPLREFTDSELVRFGAIVAREHGGELSLLNVVEIPRNLPPRAIRFRYLDDRIQALHKLTKIGAKIGVETRASVKIGHRVYEIILDTLEEEAVDLLVMGWRGGRGEGDRRILGSNIDYLIQRATCDIAVFNTKGLREKPGRILVLSSPLWSVRGVDDLALIYAKHAGASVEILSIAQNAQQAETLKRETADFLEKCHGAGVEIEQKVLYSRSFEAVALQESRNCDLLMVQASPPVSARRYPLGPVEDRIAKLAACPVLIFRKGAPPSA